MSERIITLFGEEIVPEQIKPVAKSRAKKKDDEKKEDEGNEESIKTESVIPEAAAPQAVVAEVAETIPTPVTEELPEVEKPKTAAKKKETDALKLPEDWKGDGKQYFSIGEVAEVFKVKTSHIRFWTNEFKLNVRTTRKGDRLYTEDQIKELRAIHHLVKERGFTLTGAKTKLKTQNKMDVETVDLKKSLMSLRNKLLAIRNQLK
ncbi:hypothetical protein CJD36_010500 [Flavipsychrobacter stenotrophus]|uniref:HTH merR-type domain-containing protein n=1 Tax=Flavipsychrobacter stenotrophus TaxID=2077091 RepID=A0A2S7SU00_9BACT|nr:MerR family transcriptional regulator [Flavipsychrobacter stenotrophus]PQJ10399.1 hypothetical protein CJD36_010500 [Flavipsychrobacter stenotrophus]